MANTLNKFIVEKYGIMQFDGTGYDHWRFRMEVLLEQHNVRKCIDEECNTQDEASLKSDKQCQSLLIQCIGNSQLQHVKEKTTAYQMWNSLEKVYRRKGVASQLYLRKKLLTMKFNSDDPLEHYLVKFDEVVRELKSVGAKLEETDVVCHLLLTLPKDFDNIVTALETLEPNKLTLEFVKGKLLDQEMKIKNDISEPSTSKSFLTTLEERTNLINKMEIIKVNICLNVTNAGGKVTKEMNAGSGRRRMKLRRMMRST